MVDSKEKNKVYRREWAKANRIRLESREGQSEKLKLKRARCYLKNKEKRLRYQKEYYINKSKECKLTQSEYKKNNKAVCNSNNAKYKANKKLATPKWLTKFDLDYIRHIYIQAIELEKLDGIKRHVDHSIPLRGKIVSGLHVPWNLEIITAEENIKKGNRLKF